MNRWIINNLGKLTRWVLSFRRCTICSARAHNVLWGSPFCAKCDDEIFDMETHPDRGFTLLELLMMILIAMIICGGMGALFMKDSREAERYRPMREQRAAMLADAERRSIDNCVKGGGITIISEWDSRLIDCKAISNAR